MLDQSFSLSTSWNGTRHERLTDAIAEIRGLGFRSVELYAHWLPNQLSDARSALDALGVQASSLHGPCPVPVGADGQRAECGDWLAETDEARRRLAVDAHRRTVDAAARLGARAVVVHLGNSGAPSYQHQIFDAIRVHGYGSPRHQQLLAEARAAREAARGNGAWEAATRSAVEIGEHARGTGVVIGLECRDGWVEIPQIDDYPAIFSACAGLPVGYWHDLGHGSKLENAGFIRYRDYLEAFGDRLVGVHLHDTRLDRDHQAPGRGDTDFSILAPYLQPETVRTIELAPWVEAADIGPGVEVLARAGLGRVQT